MSELEPYWYLASYPKSGNTWCRLFISELRRLAGLDPAPPAIAAAVAHTRFESLRAKEEKEGGFPERPPGCGRFFRSGRRGEGRERLTGDQLRRLGDTFAEMLQRFGYRASEPFGLEPGGRRVPPGPPAKTVVCQDFASQQVGAW